MDQTESLSKVVIVKAGQGRGLNATGILLSRDRFFNFCVLDEVLIFLPEPKASERPVIM